MSEIMVSVNCLVYNHEKYLRKCLDGVLSQKVNFRYEVLVHDDASTDNSVNIIKEYEKKYPEIIKPVYQEENQYQTGNSISWKYQYPRAKGKYIAFCEGDDFWNDENKLQQQIELLEENKQLSMCVHDVQCVNEQGEYVGKQYPQINLEEGIIGSEDVLKLLEVDNIYPFQTSCFCMRASYIHEIEDDRPEFFKTTNTGSVNLMVYLATRGDFGYIKKPMSSYRMNSVGSWSVAQRKTENRIAHLKSWIQTKQKVDEYLEYRFTKAISEQILEYEFEICRLENKYSECLQEKYRKCLGELCKKERIYIKIFGKHPWLLRIYSKVRGR